MNEEPRVICPLCHQEFNLGEAKPVTKKRKKDIPTTYSIIGTMGNYTYSTDDFKKANL